MENKKRRATKPFSPLQRNVRMQGRVLFFFNGLMPRLKFPDYDVAGLMTSEQRQRLQTAAYTVSSIKQELLFNLSAEASKIVEDEIESGVRCACCNTAGGKIKYIDQGVGLYALCKKCGNSWQVPDK